MYVYVLNQHGEPLMPCSPRKARLLLREEKAKVIKRTPFTIKLLYGSYGYKQPITLGVDAGSKTVGLSASTETQELFAAEMHPRNDVAKKLSDRRELRGARRSRKKRYRQPRFNNRANNKHKGWLTLSVGVKIQEHITIIKRVCCLLPVTKVRVETAEFDFQLIKAVESGKPVPEGEDYQKGEMFGWYNVQQYVLYRDGYRCQYCGGHGDEVKLHVHHIESCEVAGNLPDNLVTLCDCCHEMLHKGAITVTKLKKRRFRYLRDAMFMGIMRKTLTERLSNELTIPVEETKGYITKAIRERYGLAKSHITDALCIAQHPTAKRTDKHYTYKAVRHHNRQLHKATILKGGIRKANQAPYEVFGYRLFDKVLYSNVECFVWGRRVRGGFALKLINGTMVHAEISYKKIKLLERANGYLVA